MGLFCYFQYKDDNKKGIAPIRYVQGFNAPLKTNKWYMIQWRTYFEVDPERGSFINTPPENLEDDDAISESESESELDSEAEEEEEKKQGPAANEPGPSSAPGLPRGKKIHFYKARIWLVSESIDELMTMVKSHHKKRPKMVRMIEDEDENGVETIEEGQPIDGDHVGAAAKNVGSLKETEKKKTAASKGRQAVDYKKLLEEQANREKSKQEKAKQDKEKKERAKQDREKNKQEEKKEKEKEETKKREKEKARLENAKHEKGNKGGKPNVQDEAPPPVKKPRVEQPISLSNPPTTSATPSLAELAQIKMELDFQKKVNKLNEEKIKTLEKANATLQSMLDFVMAQGRGTETATPPSVSSSTSPATSAIFSAGSSKAQKPEPQAKLPVKKVRAAPDLADAVLDPAATSAPKRPGTSEDYLRTEKPLTNKPRENGPTNSNAATAASGGGLVLIAAKNRIYDTDDSDDDVKIVEQQRKPRSPSPRPRLPSPPGSPSQDQLESADAEKKMQDGPKPQDNPKFRDMYAANWDEAAELARLFEVKDDKIYLGWGTWMLTTTWNILKQLEPKSDNLFVIGVARGVLGDAVKDFSLSGRIGPKEKDRSKIPKPKYPPGLMKAIPALVKSRILQNSATKEIGEGRFATYNWRGPLSQASADSSEERVAKRKERAMKKKMGAAAVTQVAEAASATEENQEEEDQQGDNTPE